MAILFNRDVFGKIPKCRLHRFGYTLKGPHIDFVMQIPWHSQRRWKIAFACSPNYLRIERKSGESTVIKAISRMQYVWAHVTPSVSANHCDCHLMDEKYVNFYQNSATPVRIQLHEMSIKTVKYATKKAHAKRHKTWLKDGKTFIIYWTFFECNENGGEQFKQRNVIIEYKAANRMHVQRRTVIGIKGRFSPPHHLISSTSYILVEWKLFIALVRTLVRAARNKDSHELILGSYFPFAIFHCFYLLFVIWRWHTFSAS